MIKLKTLKSLRLIPIILLFIVFVAGLYCSNKKSKNTFYNNKKAKLWAHRGLSINAPENSLESIQAAFENGFKGVEIDLWFNKNTQSFHIHHDYSDSSKLTLNKIMNIYHDKDLKFWLDLKNLNQNNKNDIINNLNKLENTYHIKEKIIIESPQASELNDVEKSGYFTSLYFKPVINTIFIIRFRNIILNLFHLCYYNYSAASMPAGAYKGIIRYFCKNKNIHLWKQTKNKQDLNKWIMLPEVKIILFDGEL